MQAWKPLLIIVPTGLLLGVVGGHYAQPVMTQKADDGSLQASFETRAQRYGTAEQAQPQDATYYSGGYSYPPYLDDRMMEGDREITGWQGPSFAGWPAYEPAPLPSAEELEAQVAARNAALDQRAWVQSGAGADDNSATEAAADGAADAGTNPNEASPSPADSATVGGPKVVVLSPSAPSAEPRTADGNLPAIW